MIAWKKKTDAEKQADREANKAMFHSHSYRRGAYSASLTVVVIAIAVVAALLLNLLPDSVKKLDLTSAKLYSLGETTDGVLSSLQEDVTLTVVAQEGSVDKRIERLLSEYQSKSSHIKVAHADPVVNPSVLDTYNTTENTIVVANADGSRTANVAFTDIIVYDTASYYYYGNYVETAFDGEGQLTSAIHAVTSTSSSVIYLTEGHGESALSTTVAGRVTKLGVKTSSVNLLTAGGIPENCNLLLIYAPSADLADDELAMLRTYLQNGGRLLYIAPFDDVSLPNFDALLADYGIARVAGYIADTARYYQTNAYNIFPILDTSADPLSGVTAADATVLVYDALGYTLTDPVRDSIANQSLMTTSESGHAVSGDSDVQGQYVLAASATEDVTNGQARLAVLGCPTLLDEQILTNFPNLANADAFLSILTWFLDGVDNVSVESKSLQVTYNTVTNSAVWSVLLIFVIPLAALLGGLIIWIRRRRAR